MYAQMQEKYFTTE